MDATSPIIPQQRTPMWTQPISDPLSDDQRSEARRLGLRLGALVAFGWEAVSLGALVILGHWKADGVDLGGWIGFAVASFFPIAAGAAMGWCLGPRATLATRIDHAITIVVMAIFTMLLGDALVVTSMGAVGAVVGAGIDAEYIPLGMAYAFGIGAVVLGPFVILFATLPASIAWLVLFRARWRSCSQVGIS